MKIFIRRPAYHLFFLCCLVVAFTSHALGTSTLTIPRVFFKSPRDGATVSKTFTVKFGLAGKTLRPAGEAIEDKNAGHHHLIVDGTSIPEGEVIVVDPQHIHFGKGQTETIVALPPGKHKLTLQFADGLHQSYGPPMSATIEVTVKE